jgi:MFS family permease
VLLFALVVAALTAGDVVEVFLVLGTLHAPATLFGVISTLWMAGVLIGTALISRIELGEIRSAAAMVLLLGGTCVILVLGGVVPAIGWMLPLWLIGGVTNGGENVLAAVLVSRRAPAARRGRAFAAFGAVMNAATAIGYAIGGLLMAATGSARTVMIGMGTLGTVICVARGLPLLIAAGRVRNPAEVPLPSPAGLG